uniref:hypothetical protein n=1 Tax=Gorillibacterium sp. sgz5001074 TaxID=3446695 RepID=UPI003F673F33
TLILKNDGVQDQGIPERNRLKVFTHQDIQYLYKGNEGIHPIKTLERREGLESRLVEKTLPLIPSATPQSSCLPGEPLRGNRMNP